MGFFNFFNKPISYEKQKDIAQNGTVKQRLTLAKSSKTHREILFYLAEHDPTDNVRKKVAQNILTPLHANEIIAKDFNDDVRLALSGRLVKLLPDLSIDKQSQFYAYTVQALGTLALDEVLKIRKSLAVTLKDHAYAPPSVAAQLARDIEREVAEPILRFCVALEDDVLLDIIKTHKESWAIESVAQRPTISAVVSKAIVKSNNKNAGKYLIENKGAVLNEDVLYEIIERAKDFPEWHKPLAINHKLPQNMARKLARYTDARIRKLLQDKGGYDLDESEIVTDGTRRRIALEEDIQNRDDKNLKKEIANLESKGKLTETVIGDHLALRDYDFVYESLAYKLNITSVKIKDMFKIKKPETVCAVCWRARLSMRFCLRIQQELVGISHREALVPKQGSDYPLSEKDMLWQLEFMDVE